MTSARDIPVVSVPAAEAPATTPACPTPPSVVDESPSIVPATPVGNESAPVRRSEEALEYFGRFREFATDRRRGELAAEAPAGSDPRRINNNVQQLATLLNRVHEHLEAGGWDIRTAIALVRNHPRKAEVSRASKLLDEFERAEPATPPSYLFGAKVTEALAVANLKPSEAALLMQISQATVYRWKSGNFLPAGNKANRAAAAALETAANRPGCLQAFLRAAYERVDRPAHIHEKEWRRILDRLRRDGHCNLDPGRLLQKIEEIRSAPVKAPREPYRFSKHLHLWPAGPRAEFERYKQLAQRRSEPKWESIR